MSNQVWVRGEVVIDLIPDGTERKAVVGGGPANTAKALSKLRIPTQFIDGISSDKYGQMALKELHKDGVLLISGLPQVEDHLLGVEVLTEFLARKGELL